ncbi:MULTISPECIES: DUF5999 family protein, partial [unclassified Streptomyces]|uniref:DUF5999 family protein n=1 Tax=unclassified Streptomyces TaxID=2593676 RepID=UPI0035DF92A7
MNLLRRGAAHSGSAGRRVGSRSVVAAARETIALVLDENAPPLEGDHDVDDMILRLRGHLMELGHTALDQPHPAVEEALVAARKVADTDVPEKYVAARVHLRKFASAVVAVVTELAAAGMVCGHPVECPPATADDFGAAMVRVRRPEIECSELCNGVLVFEVMSISGVDNAAEQVLCLMDMSSSGSGSGR